MAKFSFVFVAVFCLFQITLVHGRVTRISDTQSHSNSHSDSYSRVGSIDYAPKTEKSSGWERIKGSLGCFKDGVVNAFSAKSYNNVVHKLGFKTEIDDIFESEKLRRQKEKNMSTLEKLEAIKDRMDWKNFYDKN